MRTVERDLIGQAPIALVGLVVVAVLMEGTLIDPAWLAGPLPHVGLALEKLRSGPLGPWISFALVTAPSAAIFVFVFVFVFSSFWLVVSIACLCGGRLRDAFVAFLMPAVNAGYAGACVGGNVALLGWPALWLVEQVFGPWPEIGGWALSILTLKLASLAAAAGAGLALSLGVFATAFLSGRTQDRT